MESFLKKKPQQLIEDKEFVELIGELISTKHLSVKLLAKKINVSQYIIRTIIFRYGFKFYKNRDILDQSEMDRVLKPKRPPPGGCVPRTRKTFDRNFPPILKKRVDGIQKMIDVIKSGEIELIKDKIACGYHKSTVDELAFCCDLHPKLIRINLILIKEIDLEHNSKIKKYLIEQNINYII